MIEDVVAQIVGEVAEVDPEGLDADAPFTDVEVDSLDLIEIAVEVERHFGVRFAEEELQGIRTIRSLADLARAHGASDAG